MKLISLKHRYDYGHDWYVQILSTGRHVPNPFKHFSLIQASISWNDYASWPYLQIKCGCGSTLSIMFWAYRLGIDVGFIERTWSWDYIDQFSEESESVTTEEGD